MAYVDLNLIRAVIASNRGGSGHTSIKQRIEMLQSTVGAKNAVAHQSSGMERFVDVPRLAMPEGLADRLDDYLAIVDWTWRHILEDHTRRQARSNRR